MNGNSMTPERKRHLVLDSTIFDLQIDGGISRYWFELAANLAARHDEWNLTLLANTDPANKFGRKLIEVTRNRPAVRVHRYVTHQMGRLFGPWLPSGYGEFLWHSSYYRVPTHPKMSSVCTVYDFIYERSAARAQAHMHAWIKRRAILAASEIICISEATRRDLGALYPDIPPDRCHVIHLGVSLPFQAGERGGPQSDRAAVPYVLFVGSRHGYKNFAVAVRAAEAIAGMELWVVGGGALSQAERGHLQEQLPGRHRVLDAPPDESLYELYRGAVALVYLSRFEGFGFPPLEAMASGCPVIAMRASSIPEIVGDAGMLLSSEDPMVVAEAIREAMRHERRADMIARGLKRAAMFSWDRTVDETVRIYERAAR